MVQLRRHRLHHRGLSHGADHDTGSRLPLLWARTKEIGVEHDHSMYGLVLGDHIPMVLLRIFFGFQQLRYE